MRVDFYQLSRDPVPQVVSLLARKVLQSGERLLVVSEAEGQLDEISAALWAQDGPQFLANGMAAAPHEARQPIVLGGACDAANGAAMAILADGKWREDARQFARVMLLFGPAQTEAARELWRALSAVSENAPEGASDALHIFKQGDNGVWREGR
jgi:DNA polymerase-3 subunit chi